MTGVQTCALPIFQIGVARAQCGGAKTAVQLGVAFITYANPAGVKQSNNRRDSFLPTDTRLLQVPLHARPQLGQRTAEPSAPVELVRFLSGAEIGMIAILFTALLVIPDRLDMSSGIGAEPRDRKSTRLNSSH